MKNDQGQIGIELLAPNDRDPGVRIFVDFGEDVEYPPPVIYIKDGVPSISGDMYIRTQPTPPVPGDFWPYSPVRNVR